MRTLLALGFLGSVLLACGGSTGATGELNEAGVGNDGSSGQVDGGCSGTAPELGCQSCGNAVSAVCQNGTWSCPPQTLGICFFPDSGSDSSSGDSSTGSDASTQDSSATDSSTSDGGFACAACDPQTHYCQVDYPPPPNDGGAGVPTDTCLALPTCDAAPSCACVTFGPFCTCADDGGDITVTCPFHV